MYVWIELTTLDLPHLRWFCKAGALPLSYTPCWMSNNLPIVFMFFTNARHQEVNIVRPAPLHAHDSNICPSL